MKFPKKYKKFFTEKIIYRWKRFTLWKYIFIITFGDNYRYKISKKIKTYKDIATLIIKYKIFNFMQKLELCKLHRIAAILKIWYCFNKPSINTIK